MYTSRCECQARFINTIQFNIFKKNGVSNFCYTRFFNVNYKSNMYTYLSVYIDIAPFQYSKINNGCVISIISFTVKTIVFGICTYVLF